MSSNNPIEAGSIELSLFGGEVSTVLYALAHAPSGATVQCEGLAVRIETAPRDPSAPYVSISVPLLANEIGVVEQVVGEIADHFRRSKSPDMARIYEHVLAKIAEAPRRAGRVEEITPAAGNAVQPRSAITLKPGDVVDIPGTGSRVIGAIEQPRSDRYRIRLDAKFEPSVTIDVLVGPRGSV